VPRGNRIESNPKKKVKTHDQQNLECKETPTIASDISCLGKKSESRETKSICDYLPKQHPKKKPKTKKKNLQIK
jgi:hypothetical protein